jgi:type I restriction enzyme R subunit
MPSSNTTPEKEARRKIDQQLRRAGWTLIDDHLHYDDLDSISDTGFVEELGTETGPADYGLIIDGDLVAIIESKPESENAAGHFQQAERYAKSVQGPYDPNESYGIPVAYVATGSEYHLYDFRSAAPTSRPVVSIHSPAGLKRLASRDYNQAQAWLKDHPASEFDPDLWDHQKECVAAVEESLENRERRMLVQMATGSGKTRVAQTLTYRLLESGFGDSVLFIPDTRKLANDAYNSFSSYEPTGADAPFSDKYRIVNLEEEEGSRLNRGEVVITTLQKMYYLLDNDDVEFCPGDFDLIITDECHRSIYQNEGYGGVLQQFDAVEIGLTATPTQRTVSRFDNNLVYEYDYEEAVSDEYVVPFQMYALETRITMSGVRDKETGEYYPPDTLGREVLVPDTHRKVGEELREQMEDDTELTLIFARNDDHATQIVRDLRETVFSDKPDSFIQKITYKADRPNDTLNRFSDPYDPSPAIAVTVQMVSTGVDIRPLKNIILLNPVKSPVQFNQMLGRGTRIYDDKTHFNIFDCVGAFEYFEGTPPFGTLEYEHPGNDGSSTDNTGGSDSEDGPKVVNVPDEVLRSEPVFPTETGERLTAAGFREAFRQDVRSEMERIVEQIERAPDIESANEVLRSIVEEKSQYYVFVFLEKAYEPVAGDGERLLIDYVNEALTGRLPTFDQRKAQARSQLENDYDLSDVEKQYSELITAVSEPLNGIAKDDFYDPPISEIGGWKRAQDQFTSLTPQKMINEFRDQLCDIVGDIEGDYTPIEETGTQQESESKS